MNRIAVFVLSDTRSGSTLLDQCLGGHPRIMSLGEVHWLPAYAAQDRSVYDPAHPLVCNCGEVITECPFWTSVERLVGRPLATLQVRVGGSPISEGKRWHIDRRRLLSLAMRLPRAYRLRSIHRILAGKNLASDCIQLFDAVSKVTGRDVCVDSSKSAIRFRMVYDAAPDRTRAIVLTRDARAVVYSKMKRGRSLEQAANGWRHKMQSIESLTTGVVSEHVHVMKYETLCENPERELSGICRFLGVAPSDTMLRRPTENLHNIGGSPSKFDRERIAIRLDKTFETQLGEKETSMVMQLVGRTAKRWGY